MIPETSAASQRRRRNSLLLIPCLAIAATALLGACSDSRTAKLISLCKEDSRRSTAECRCQARVMQSSLSNDDLDMLLRMGSVKTAEERMSIMREAGRNEQQFMAWGKAFQKAVAKATKECRF
ncbi:MAG TPA: hypothetical protein VKA19_05830 [Alphaproteobacteria bacterium]|nr:hypothetical protein [Alphaproteobacteria bacterium]